MAYENISLHDMMEEARRFRDSQEVNNDRIDDFFIDEIFDPEPPAPPVPPDIDETIRQVLEELKEFTLDEKSQQITKEFLTFWLQTKTNSNPEARKTFYNLILIAEEPDTALHAVDTLSSALRIPASVVNKITEESALSCFEKDRQSSITPAGTKLLLIHKCKDAPRMNTDGGSALRDKSLRAVENHRGFWRYICTYARMNPQTIVIVSGDKSAFRSSLRPNGDLSSRVCSHHITLNEPTCQMLLDKCLEIFRGSSLAVSAEFETALRSYFPAAFRATELSGRRFVEELVRRVYSRYFCQKRTDSTLTADCVPDDNPKFQSAEAILGQMDELIGLKSAKEEFSNIYKMQLAGLSEASGRYHMLFAGNPGTGKTTVAKMAADLLYSMNVIRRNKVVCVKPCDMVSEWIGGTGTKAMEVIRRAYNGVLFIDEAYGIATMDRGEELLNILVQEMEENSDKLVVILAGYTHEMRELMKANPGLASRIGRHIQFDDYNLDELAEIFLLMCEKEGFTLDPDARDELEDCIASLMTMEFFGNARAIRNMLQELKEAWSEEYYQIAQEVGEDNVTLPKQFRARHFERILPPKKEVSIRDLIGLQTMKQKLENFKQQALFQRHLREKGITGLSDFSMHMIFTGNPGTGKTTVAKLIADDLYSIGMLKTNRLVVAERKDLVSYYGDTAKRTADLVNKAVGGVLFIDEAYSLADRSRGGLGSECIEVLLTAMEEHKSDTVFIFAGYVNEMQDFLATNPGIQSRIGYTFHFEDYTADELTEMFDRKMQKTGFHVSVGALNQVHKIMEYFQEVRNFGNGRFVDHVIHQTISRRAKRDFTRQYRNIQQRDIPSIRELVETAPNGMHLYDPGQTTQEDLRKTAVHELGHAFIMLGAEPKELPKTVSIRNHAGSLGRVSLAENNQLNRTEKELLKHIAILLGGMNAEKAIYGTHDTGCLSDYRRAKNTAADMIEKFGMMTFGETPEDILKSADKLSANLIQQYKDCFEPLIQLLLKDKEITGAELEKALKKLNK